MRVFLSSTYEDLKAHREVLMDTLRKMGDEVQTVAMEHFGSDPRSPYEVCQEKVSECDVYIGLFGWRYGSVEPKSRLSMTEIEYRTALAKGVPPYLYFLSEKQAVLPAAVDMGVAADKIRKLKEEMAGHHVVQTFTTPEDLSRLVVADLARHMQSGQARQEVMEVSGPVGPELNPGHPYLLCHAWDPVPDGEVYSARLYIDVYEDEEAERKKLLKAIDRVVYQLHKSFIIPVVPMQNWEEHFVLEIRIYGEFWVRSTIYLKDQERSPIQLTRYINLFLPKAIERSM